MSIYYLCTSSLDLTADTVQRSVFGGQLMKTLITNLLASVLLIQALTGWCCSHACACSNSTNRVSICAVPVNQCCGKCEKRTVPAKPAKPCKCQECHGLCTYLPTQKTHRDSAKIASPFDLAESMSWCALPTGDVIPRSTLELSTSHLAQPLRLHLLHQIFLI